MSECCSDNKAYDVAVIGAGSAGFSAGITAADEGARVLIIGHGTIGGTCVNVGCVPSKALIRAADTLHISRVAERFEGIKASAEVTDWAAVIAQKQALVDDLRKAKYSDILPAYQNITYLAGKASFTNDGKLQVDGESIDAKKIIIATGSRQSVPDIAGIETVSYLTSTTALEMTILPNSLMILGAGYIGVEIAQIFARAGVDVTLICRRGLLPDAEPEISAALTTCFKAEGIKVISGISYKNIQQRDDAVVLVVENSCGEIEISAQKIMIATGRQPNSDGLKLPGAKIDVTKNGGIIVDDHMRTSRAGVYAAGDVTGNDQFVYMAAYGAKIAAKNAVGDGDLVYDNSVMPAVVFSDPQVASVGLTEVEAIAQGLNVRTSVLSLDNVPRALAARNTEGLIKLIADGATKKLIGAHILAPEGADCIQTAAIAIKTGMTYEDLGAMIFPYLTTVEGLKLAAQTFDMDVKKLSCCAG
ncbi:MAG: mercury(II) reductase [Cohaesibacteraceae bacterium]|nr:mercury(II) reductase [Cohaesibacteraceae bacterium]